MKSTDYHWDGETGLLSKESLRSTSVMCDTADTKHCLELVLDTKYWADVFTVSTSAAQLHEKPARTACLPKYRHAFAAVHKLFSISPTYEWINTDKRRLNVVPELCFDSCRLFCLPLGLSFNYIRLTQCFICHPWQIAGRDKFSHGMNRFSLLTGRKQCLVLSFWITHYP